MVAVVKLRLQAVASCSGNHRRVSGALRLIAEEAAAHTSHGPTAGAGRLAARVSIQAALLSPA